MGVIPGHLEGQRELIADSRSVFGLSDGGAHCGVLVDASVPTYMLTYFTRDRQRGPKMTPEFIVHKMTRDTAELYGLEDRGLVKAGFKADFNVIDYENLTLLKPEMVYDLPGGGKRLVQCQWLQSDDLQRRCNLSRRRTHGSVAGPFDPWRQGLKMRPGAFRDR